MSLKNRGRFFLSSRQRGFTLIEIMVTVIVLAIGLLGLAGLQATALKFNSTAYQRSQATILIYDIIERIRAQPIAQTAIFPYLTCSLDINSSGCSGPAQQDVQNWRNAIASTLPNPTGDIRLPDTGVITIRIAWDDSRGENSPRTVTVRTNL